jgi:plasmid stability protein
MPSILIRNVPEKTMSKLKAIARQHNQSLQQGLKDILENLADYSPSDISKKALSIRRTLKKKGLSHTDSAELLREDRCR